ncbi:hypothetical protein AQUCO_01200081v1 [Aquilegia coerulea]|uniref:Uncharacterized protein n=2 Tax=Aquilegia coerulea TaxID=218851 RepID=A0A2G5E4C1_AQUCA|nr:hypothetical protein AQUCO_01200081v1 [Aquilegia coerulea]
MYSNNSESVRDALCFFMDEQKSHDIGFVQFPQSFYNLTKKDIYGSSLSILREVELPGMDACGGPPYIGTGCFHRREALCGKKYGKEFNFIYEQNVLNKVHEGATKLEERAKILADCTFEEGTQWGKEMGLKYGCAVEDVLTGLSIHCRGWKSVYFNPTRKGFLGVAPITLGQTLVQFKRWSGGNLEILLSKYGPLSYGVGRIKLGHRLAYCLWCFWAPNWLATLYYSVIPSLYLLKGISLFPRITSPWFLPFAYVIITETLSSLGEFLCFGSTLQCWWNEQRIWMFKRTTSYLFGFIDTLLNLFGFANSGFNITTKVTDQDASKRYEKDIMEFGNSSLMFIILATLAMLNLFCLLWGLERMIMNTKTSNFESLFLQVLLCGCLVIINLPIYNGLFFRKDSGHMPTSVTVKSIILAVLSCFLILY